MRLDEIQKFYTHEIEKERELQVIYSFYVNKHFISILEKICFSFGSKRRRD